MKTSCTHVGLGDKAVIGDSNIALVVDNASQDSLQLSPTSPGTFFGVDVSGNEGSPERGNFACEYCFQSG